MSKEILLFSKSIFEIEGEKKWLRHGFVVHAEYDKDQDLDIEKMATEFSEEIKKAFLKFAYGEDMEKKELSPVFLEIFGRA